MRALTPRKDWDPQAWRSELFAPIAHVLKGFEHEADWPSVAQMNARLRPRLVEALGDDAPHFEEQILTPKRRRLRVLRARADLYDAQICLGGRIPTRAQNWHDFFNACVWAWLPRTKFALATRQFEAACERVPEHFVTLPSVRSREQDALALFDEGGVLRTGSSQIQIFGHAVYEHLVSHDDRIWGFDVSTGYEGGDAAELDAVLCSALRARAWPPMGAPSKVWLQRAPKAAMLG